MVPFDPLFRNPHLQTIAGHYWKRPPAPAFPVERRFYRTEPDVQVLVESQRPAGEAAGEIVMVHGLEGSSEAGYMVGLAASVLRAGFAAHRFNMRTCGGTERLCNTLYHAGLTGDLLAVLRDLVLRQGRAPVFLVGFSLGGNLVLKLAGELGDAALPLVRGVVAVSAPLDLAACSDRIAQPDNRFYERRFVYRMRDRLCATGRFRPEDFAVLDTVRGIDDRITAPSFGFGTAENYYRTQSAVRFLPGIRVPGLLIQAMDDTFIPFEIYRSEAARANPRVELLVTEHGGHLGFIGRKAQRFWADQAIVDWIRRQKR